MSEQPPDFRTPEQVAKRTGLSRKAIYRAIERGELTAYRLCGRLRIATADEQEWIKQSRVQPAPSATPPPAAARPATTAHSLRRLLQDHRDGPGLVAPDADNATADSHK